MTVVLVGIAIAAGLVGTLLPILPGLGLIWLATVVYGVVEGFGVGGWVSMAAISGLLAAGLVAGIRIPQRAAAGGGIGVRGQLVAAALAVVGFFAVPVVGAGLGFVVGVYLVARHSAPDQAWETTRRTVLALLASAGVQFAAGLLMALVWAGWVVFG